MRQEKAFSKDGFYKFVLDSNLMLHEHVANRGCAYLHDWLQTNPAVETVSVLDLACGGLPVAIAQMIARCPERKFRYTGVDINPDQVEEARSFSFPGNVVSTHLEEGNAWEFASLDLDERYDIIFSGMNLHHGTPEEIYCLLLQCRHILSDRGLFINHDFYRPAQFPYLRRPDFNPANPSESFAMISAQTLAALDGADCLDLLPALPYAGDVHSDWRVPFMERYKAALKDKGAPEEGIQQVVTHVISRDFPISTPEMAKIAAKAGFKLTVLDLQASDQRLGDHFTLVVALPT